MTASHVVIITDPLGLHARPAADFVARARGYESELIISHAANSASCKSLLGILRLGVVSGSEVMITATGPDEEEAVQSLVAFLERPHDTGAP